MPLKFERKKTFSLRKNDLSAAAGDERLAAGLQQVC